MMLAVSAALVVGIAAAQEAPVKLTAVRDYLATASILNSTAVSKCNMVWLGAADMAETYEENGKALLPLREKFALAVRRAAGNPDLMAHLRRFRTAERELSFVACADTFEGNEPRKAKLDVAQAGFDRSKRELLTAIEIAEALPEH